MDGIRIGPGVVAELSNIRSSHNGRHGLFVDRADVSIDGMSAEGNGGHGIYVTDTDLEEIEQVIAGRPAAEQPSLRKWVADVTSGVVSGVTVEGLKAALGIQ
jgi:hypothetical protein